MEDPDSLFVTRRADGTSAGPEQARARVQARWIFLIAAGYGLLVLLPMYLRPTAAMSDPVYYYGFIGVACAWQVAFLLIVQDPLRFRWFILPAILEKLGFGVAALLLYAEARAPARMALAGGLDLAFAAAFGWAWHALRERA